MKTGRGFRLGYIPALDGIRAVAVLMVLVFHSNPYHSLLQTGFLGVDIFFVLSGFLITRILLNELIQTGTVDVKKFYVHRFMRLTPPLLLMLVLYSVIAPLAWPDYTGHLRDALIAGIYLSDYGVAFWEAPKMLRHTWSLSVEEHFYVLWPLVLILLRPYRPRTLLLALFSLYLAGTLWRAYCAATQGWNPTYYRFDTHFSGLMLGAFLAALMDLKWRRLFTPRVLALLVLLMLFLLFMLFARLDKISFWGHVLTLQYGVFAAEWVAALAILLIINGNVIVRWLAWWPLIYIGRLSYGIYLFHYPIMLYLREFYSWKLVLPIGLISAFLLAAISYHTIEAWVRQWRATSSGLGHLA